MARNIGVICIMVIYFGAILAGAILVPVMLIGDARHNAAIRSVIAIHGDHWDFDKLDQSRKSPAGFLSSGQIDYTFTDGSNVTVSTWSSNIIVQPDVSDGETRWAHLRHPRGREMAYGRYILEVHVRPGEQESLARVPATI